MHRIPQPVVMLSIYLAVSCISYLVLSLKLAHSIEEEELQNQSLADPNDVVLYEFLLLLMSLLWFISWPYVLARRLTRK